MALLVLLPLALQVSAHRAATPAENCALLQWSTGFTELSLRTASQRLASACPQECCACQPGGGGSGADAGGVKLNNISFVCTAFCSIPFSGVRYCGNGENFVDYRGANGTDCSGCTPPTPATTSCATECLSSREGEPWSGGVGLEGGVCTSFSSRVFGSERYYCGEGETYESNGIDCTSCDPGEKCNAPVCESGDTTDGGLDLVNGQCNGFAVPRCDGRHFCEREKVVGAIDCCTNITVTTTTTTTMVTCAMSGTGNSTECVCSSLHGDVRPCASGPEYMTAGGVNCSTCTAPIPVSEVGTNLPTTQGTTGFGAYLQGVYQFDYAPGAVSALVNRGFTSARFTVNVESVNNESAAGQQFMGKLRSYVEAMRGRAIICMFDDNGGTDGGAPDGKIGDRDALIQAWSSIHVHFAAYPEVMYEIFNNPSSYRNATEYVLLMTGIIEEAGLPKQRCILDGLGNAADIRSVAALWPGYLGYHFFSTNLRAYERGSAYDFKRLFLADVQGLASRVYVTEFGADLSYDLSYENETRSQNGNTEVLQGMRSALLALRDAGESVRGIFHWHGWHNSDSYDLWECANSKGASMITSILAVQAGPSATHVKLGYEADRCTDECKDTNCNNGNGLKGNGLDGRSLFGGKCAYECASFGSESNTDNTTYCGTGEKWTVGATGTSATSSTNCESCRCPPECGGLPCELHPSYPPPAPPPTPGGYDSVDKVIEPCELCEPCQR